MSTTRPFHVTPPARLLIGLFALAAALHTLGVGAGPATTDLDPSWTAVLGWATAHGLQFGEEIVLTYGPLGFLFPGAAYVAEIYPLFLAGQIGLAVLFGLSCLLLLSRLKPRQRLLYCIAGLTCAPWISADVVWLLFLAQNAVLLCLPTLGHGVESMQRWSGVLDRVLIPALFGLAAAAIALLKFSMLPVALVMVLSTALSLSLEKRVQAATWHVLGAIAGLLGLWLLSGQSLQHLPGFMLGSAEVAAGYGNAMGLMPPLLVDLLGFGSMALSGGWLGWQVLVQRSKPARAIVLFALGCAAFVAWRQGFTRADGHIHQTFPLLTLLPLLGIALHDRLGRPALLAGLAVSSIALTTGLGLAHQQLEASRWTQVFARMPNVLEAYTRVDALVQQRETLGEQLRAVHALPQIRERVGESSVDLLNWEQGLLILHRMNYQPRPVFQSYSAYTPTLMRLNEAHFLKADAPEFVLLKLQAIDGRLPQAEDALALSAILRTYAPVLEEAGFVLMQRAVAGHVDTLPTPEFTQSAELGSWVDLPASKGPKFVALRAPSSALGSLYSFWFRTPPLIIEIETLAGVRSSYRLLPRGAEAGFLLSPLIRSSEQLAGLYTGQSPESVRRFRVYSQSPAYSALWKGSIELGFNSFRWQRPTAEQVSGLVPDTARAGFRIRDRARAGLVQRIDEEGRSVLFMHAPANLDFVLPTGEFILRGQFGIRSAALDDAGCLEAKADGIRLAVYSLDAEGVSHPVQTQDINPWTQASQRGAQELTVALPRELPRHIRISVEPGPAGAHAACDWGWVEGLRLETSG